MKILTVSIAAYNVEQFLSELLQQFLDYPAIEKLELLIINDGSTDGTLRIAKQFEAAKPDCFKVIDKTNGGWGSTVNVGIQNATGKYFRLLDSDDQFDMNHLSDLLDYLETCDSDMVVSPYYRINASSGEIIEPKSREEYEYSGIYDISAVNGLFMMHEITSRTALLKENNITITENCFYTDTEYAVKCLLCAHTIRSFNEPIYMYRVHYSGQSMSLENQTKNHHDFFRVIETLHEYRKQYEAGTDQYRLIDQTLLNSATHLYYVLLSAPPTRANKKTVVAYDAWIHTHLIELYDKSEKLFLYFRKTGYLLYPYFARTVRKAVEQW